MSWSVPADMGERELARLLFPSQPAAYSGQPDHPFRFYSITLIAASLGYIECLSSRTVKYRQHANNDTGAKKWSFGFIIKAIFSRRQLYRESFTKTHNQACALFESGKLDNEQRAIVSQYINLVSQGWLHRRFTIFRMGFLKYGVTRNIALMLWI